MVYNERMDSKLNEIVSKWKNITYKKMFGGIGYLLNGNMVTGIYKDYYILRLGQKQANTALKILKVKVMDITGRPMKGWIMAEEDAFSDNEVLQEWLHKAKQFVEKLPKK
jgi:TfoX/Sxy family transcriptional regulator of competence genes